MAGNSSSENDWDKVLKNPEEYSVENVCEAIKSVIENESPKSDLYKCAVEYAKDNDRSRKISKTLIDTLTTGRGPSTEVVSSKPEKTSVDDEKSDLDDLSIKDKSTGSEDSGRTRPMQNMGGDIDEDPVSGRKTREIKIGERELEELKQKSGEPSLDSTQTMSPLDEFLEEEEEVSGADE